MYSYCSRICRKFRQFIRKLTKGNLKNLSQQINSSILIILESTDEYIRLSSTARKTIFSFSKCSKKMVFPNRSHWNMIFLILSGKMIFCFTRKYDIFFFRRKMKDDYSQEIHGMIFSVYMYKCYKYDITLLPKNERRSSPEKIHLRYV